MNKERKQKEPIDYPKGKCESCEYFIPHVTVIERFGFFKKREIYGSGYGCELGGSWLDKKTFWEGCEDFNRKRRRMNDKYWWLKANGDTYQIDADEYHALVGSKSTVAHTYGLNHIIISKGDSVSYLKTSQLNQVLINR